MTCSMLPFVGTLFEYRAMSWSDCSCFCLHNIVYCKLPHVCGKCNVLMTGELVVLDLTMLTKVSVALLTADERKNFC